MQRGSFTSTHRHSTYNPRIGSQFASGRQTGTNSAKTLASLRKRVSRVCSPIPPALTHFREQASALPTAKALSPVVLWRVADFNHDRLGQ